MNLYTNKYVHIVKCSSHFTQLQLPQLILVYILKKEDDKQIFISTLYGSLLFKEHTAKWTKSTQKCPKQREIQHIF